MSIPQQQENAATVAGAAQAIKAAAQSEVAQVETAAKAEAVSLWTKVKPYVIYAAIAVVSALIGHVA